MVLTLLKNTADAGPGIASPITMSLDELVAQTRACIIERIDQVETST